MADSGYAGGERTYPLLRLTEDKRFSLGLVIGVIKVLVEHGYPKVEQGRDLVELQMALFNFLYEHSEVPR